MLKPITGARRFFLFLMTVPLAFDFFAAVPGGSLFQFVIISLTACGMAGLILSSIVVPGGNYLFRREALLAHIVTLFIAGSIFSAIINEVPLSQYLRVGTAYYLFCAGFLTVYFLIKRGHTLEQLYSLIFFGMVVAAVWSFLYATLVLKLDIATVRYQILAATTPHLLGLTLYQVLQQRRLFSLEVATVIGISILILLSITRSYILVSGLVVVVYYYAMSKSFTKFLLHLLVASGALGIFIIAGIGLSTLVADNVSDRWSQRVVEGKTFKNRDINYVTRIAEFTSQYKLVTSSTASILMGRGMGSTYTWDPEYLPELLDTFQKKDVINIEAWFAGHSLWVYTLYSGGLLFGFPFLLLFVTAVWKGLKNIKQNTRTENSRLPDYYYKAFFGLIAVIGASFTSNPIYARYPALVTGIFIATLLFRHNSKKENEFQTWNISPNVITTKLKIENRIQI